MFKVNYSYELNKYMNKLKFEKQRYFDILKYLSSQEDSTNEIIEEYYNKTFEAFLLFELSKEEIINMTCPSQLKELNLKYTINLDEGFIEYEL